MEFPSKATDYVTSWAAIECVSGHPKCDPGNFVEVAFCIIEELLIEIEKLKGRN